MAEEATPHEAGRKAVPTEAKEGSIGTQSNQTLFCRLTLELSRPVAGRRTCASVAQSTRPTPRHGVGLNELLGGGGCRCEPSPGAFSENRSGKARTRTCELSAGLIRSDSISREKTDRHQTPLPKPANVTPAMCERAKRCHRSGNVPRDCPKSTAKRSPKNAIAESTTTERFSAA